MFKKMLTIHTLSAVMLMGGVAFTSTSCTQNQQNEVSAESDQAYNDFKTFVSDTETKADAVATEAEADYERETTQLKSDFDARVAAVDKYADSYDDARRQEIEQLRTRYTTAYDKREMAWKNRPGVTSAMAADGALQMGKYYKPTNPAAQLTAANARQTYEAFVRDIKVNENKYDINDWRYINAEWRALDEAYDKVKKDIPARDLAEIQKEKLKYAAFKSYDKAEARVAQGADATKRGANKVADETQDERSAVGRAASKAGSAVKGAYKEVKSEVKNTDND